MLLTKSPTIAFAMVAMLSLGGGTLQAQQPSQDSRTTAPDVGIRSNPPSTIALTNATIVIDATRQIERGSLLIQAGRITAVDVQIDIPPDAEVIDCEGDYLYPAFIDACVEWESEEATSEVPHWNPSVVPERRMALSLKEDSELKTKLRNSGFGIISALPKGKIIKGQSCVLTTADAPLAECLLRADSFQHIRLYPDRSAGGYPNSPMGAVALVRQILADAQWYQSAKQSVASEKTQPGPAYDIALETLAKTIQGAQPVMIDGVNELYALRADQIAREFSLQLVVRGSGREYRRLDAIAAMNRTLVIPVDFPDAPEVDTLEKATDTTLQELMHWKLAPKNPGLVANAGIDFVLTGDGLDDRGDFLDRVNKAIEAGLEPAVALAALTTLPAELLGIGDIAGSLEKGKLANILRVKGDLFADDFEIAETWVEGSRFQYTEDVNPLLGDWQINLENDSFLQLNMRLSEKRGKLTGRVAMPGIDLGNKEATPKDSDSDAADDEQAAEGDSAGGPATLKQAKFDGLVLSGKLDVGELIPGERGTAFVNASYVGEDAGQQKMVGSMTWFDGTSSPIIVVRDTAIVTQDKEKEKEDEEDEDKSAADDIEVAINYPLGAYGVTEQPEQPTAVLFRGATLWTCGEDGVLESADLLIEKGTISAIGADLDVPENCQIVDASGLHISPGIIDCHSHMATDGGVNESGQAITAEVRIGDFIDPNDINIYRQLAGGVTTSNILHGSANPIGGQNQVIKLRWGRLGEELKMTEAPAGIKFALGENVKQSNRSSENRTRYPQTRMGVEQILRDRFEAAKAYRQAWNLWTTKPQGLAPRRDLELECIAEILEGKRWVHCHSYRQDEILATIRVLDDYGVTIGSFQHILEGYKVADAMAKHGATGSSFSDWWAYKFEVYDAIPYNGAIMHNAGVIVSFNSDDRELARHLNHEAAKAVKYGGVPESEALKFVTLNPAKQLRIDQWVGSLEVGKHADLVVWKGKPLSTLSVCEQTWVDGRKYFDRELDRQRWQQDQELHRKLVQEILTSGAKTAGKKDDDPSYWWARYDEFCHHSAHEHDEHEGHNHEEE